MGAMSYDLAVWVGPRPLSAAAADAEYVQRMDAMEATFEQGDDAPPVAPAIVAFVEAALARYPELDEESGNQSPWASSPLIGDAVGDLIYFPMTFSGAEYARDVLAEIASSLGLVCYDPQIEQLLPNADATPASEIRAQADAALEAFVEQRSGESNGRRWFNRLFNRQ